MSTLSRFAKDSKRVRHVYDTDMVAHLWANRAQESARNATNNFYFNNGTIYSYGSHFPIAQHIKRNRKAAVLFTTRDYSVTTSGHKWVVLRACQHLTVFHVKNPTDSDRKAQFNEYRQRFVELARKYTRARANKPWVLSSLRDLVAEANGFAAFFGLRSRLTVPDEAVMVAECRAIEQRERLRKQREEAKKRREYEARKSEAAAKLNEWANGGPIDRFAFGGFDLPIRLRIKGDELETSRGAIVPLAHAVKAFRIIKRLHDKGQAYERNGHTVHLGHFALDAIDAQGNVRAGCHNVTWEEIERIATIAGVN